MKVYELNMDGLVGPSHHYGGLSLGNIASTSNALTVANPAAAAHQGIEKMRLLYQLGIKQAVIPPHPRPNLSLLSRLGFEGNPAIQVRKAKKIDRNLLSACYSSSSMWAANAATVSSSLDTQDHRVHFTAANLVTNLHRHQESDVSCHMLKRFFNHDHFFQHHLPLPDTVMTGDEGAANYSRLCKSHNQAGIHLFVYGKKIPSTRHFSPAPVHFPARQTLEASQAIARLHQLNPKQVLFACQNPVAIDQGVFHNDVVAVANENVLLLHEEAFLHQQSILAKLRRLSDFPLQIIEVSNKRVTVADAVESYLFNSQLVTLPASQNMVLIAPIECKTHKRVKAFLDDLLADEKNPIIAIYYLDLKQSMKNGGGPACLRLRVPLNEEELSAMHQGILVNEELLDALDLWVQKHYRHELHVDDLDDPTLIDECFTALDELSTILSLKNLYPFQRFD